MQSNRYVFLDAIRGIAAIFVFMRHTHEFWGVQFFRSYLAVDIFFVLSGFVIAHAYERKLSTNQISIAGFFRLRLIRLYPMYFLSILVTAVVAIALRPFNLDLTSIGLTIGLMMFFLPVRTPGESDLFALNGPYWSLCYEIIANLVYAVARRILTTRVLTSIICVMAVLLTVSSLRDSLDQGSNWGFGSTVTGIARSMFGIFLGLLLYRRQEIFSKHLKKAAYPWGAILVICAILASPSFGGFFNRLFDVIAVVLIFPVCLIAASTGTTRFNKSLVYLGTISYPIYVLHVPLKTLLLAVAPQFVAAHAPVSGIFFLMVLSLTAVGIERIYDIPVRRWLSRKNAAQSPNGLEPSSP